MPRTVAAFFTISMLCAFLASPAMRAQEAPPSDSPTIRIVGAGRPKVPIAIPAFEGGADPKIPGAAAALHDVLRDDLLFSNFFSLVPDEYLKLVGSFDDKRGNYKEWQGIGAEALLIGLARADNPTGAVFEGRVYDTAEQRMVLGKRYRGESDQTRLMAHKMADETVLQYTGQRGIAMTRIAYVSQVGKGKEIFVMDYDGARPTRITANGSINISPAWSPDRQSIAYLSFKGNSPQLIIQSSDGGHRTAFPQKGELNSAPAWSPDGRLLAFSSARDGNAEIYVLQVPNGTLTRLTRNEAIDTAPTWSPDGRALAFTSDRSGSPQMWQMDSDGGNQRRLDIDLAYCDEADWSPPPNNVLAFTARVPGGFDIYAYDMSAKPPRLIRLTSGNGSNERPRWSPDGRHLAFASDRTGSSDIFTMDANGDHVRRLTKGGNNSSPFWSR